MKLVNYRCEDCFTDFEEMFNDTEDSPETLDDLCEECGGKYIKWNFKANDHVWKWNDGGGL